MADSYVARIAGRFKTVMAIISSTGAADGGKIIATRADGKLDPSLFPTGFGDDATMRTSGEALPARSLVYVDAGGLVRLAFAGVGGNAAQGFVLTAVAANAPVLVYWEGTIAGFSGLTPGAFYYLSDVTAGGVALTPVAGAGKIDQRIGVADSATSIQFEGEEPVELGA